MKDLAPLKPEHPALGIPVSGAVYRLLDIFPSVCCMALLFLPVEGLWHMKMLKYLHAAARDGWLWTDGVGWRVAHCKVMLLTEISFK